MDENVIYIKKYTNDDSRLLPVNDAEVLRYAGLLGAKEVDANLREIMDKAILEALPLFTYKVCYRRLPLSWDADTAKLHFDATSKDLSLSLTGCDEYIMFCATIGMGIDRLIARNQRSAMTKTLFLQAFGAERIEALCDAFCNEINEELKPCGKTVKPRFSPGYGDLALDTQKEFFRLLDCNRQIGVALNESLLMTPTKSVTAIFGIKSGCDGGIHKKENKCGQCKNEDCQYRTGDL